MRHGGLFLHEHPMAASSWQLPCIQEVMAAKGVRRVAADQCQFGSVDEAGSPVKKPTYFLGNSEFIMDALSKRCSGTYGCCSNGSRHAWCTGKTARRAAIYPFRLCRAILRGLQADLKARGRWRDGDCGTNVVFEDVGESHLLSLDCDSRGLVRLKSV